MIGRYDIDGTDAFTRTSMPKVEIYTTTWCPYCNAAKSMLDEKGVPYSEINADDPQVRMDMVQRAHGRRTVPQIFVGNTHVGGYDEMAALERRGKLDPLLAE
jgi:glutaredoxin 3